MKDDSLAPTYSRIVKVQEYLGSTDSALHTFLIHKPLQKEKKKILCMKGWVGAASKAGGADLVKLPLNSLLLNFTP